MYRPDVALLVERGGALVEPVRDVGEVRINQGVEHLVDERARAGPNVHHQRFVVVRVVAVVGHVRIIKELLRHGAVAGFIGEQVDLQEAAGLLLEILPVQRVRTRPDRALHDPIEGALREIAQHDKVSLDRAYVVVAQLGQELFHQGLTVGRRRRLGLGRRIGAGVRVRIAAGCENEQAQNDNRNPHAIRTDDRNYCAAQIPACEEGWLYPIRYAVNSDWANCALFCSVGPRADRKRRE